MLSAYFMITSRQRVVCVFVCVSRCGCTYVMHHGTLLLPHALLSSCESCASASSLLSCTAHAELFCKVFRPDLRSAGQL